MTNIDTSWLVAVAIFVAVALGLAAWLYARRHRQTLRLKDRFGPEYGRAVDALGGRARAESELTAREKRVRDLPLAPLSASEAARFGQAWSALQGRFVDSPKGVLAEADQLVQDLLLKRGYPAGDFETSAANVSVGHSAVVEKYRLAHAISVRDQRGEADTEELRQAVVCYRALFNELLTAGVPGPVAAAAAPVLAHS